MPYNPLTGQYDNYEDSYNTLGGIGASALDSLGAESGTAMRMMENMPGIGALMGYATLRGSNTIMSGPTRLGSIPTRFGTLGYNPSADNGRQFLGRSSRKQAAMAAGKSPVVKGFMANYMGPSFLSGKFSGIGVFGNYGSGNYSPFRMGEALNKRGKVKSFFESKGVVAGADGNMLGPGLISAVSAGRRMDKLERRALAGSARAVKKLEKADRNLRAIAQMNNPARAHLMDDFLVSKTNFTQGVRGNLLASHLGGAGTQATAGAFRASLGATAVGLSGNALQGYKRVMEKTALSLGDDGIVGRGGRNFVGKQGAQEILEKGFLKTLGTKGTASIIGSGGYKMAGIAAMRTAGLAIPGVQVIAAASLAYDLGKMGGEIVKSGINLARDANISMQGSLAKPTFGMGYRDTEAAATSRSRGVMAIQNSRLNARSALGGEAAMLAAHYG
jgi:hypothetical protein